jgi:hypothetical protein
MVGASRGLIMQSHVVQTKLTPGYVDDKLMLAYLVSK